MSELIKLVQNISDFTLAYGTALLLPNSVQKKAIISSMNASLETLLNEVAPMLQQAAVAVKVQQFQKSSE